MIDDLLVRRDHWNSPTNRAPYDDFAKSDIEWPYPADKLEQMTSGLDVLEIGPGRGRIYARLRDKVKSYSICDIAPNTLTESVFEGVDCRILLSDYDVDRHWRWDVIHFWYVLHHIKVDELEGFFGFVVRHLRPSGFALFNLPILDQSRLYTGDGIGTTWISESDVMTDLPIAMILEELDGMYIMRWED